MRSDFYFRIQRPLLHAGHTAWQRECAIESANEFNRTFAPHTPGFPETGYPRSVRRGWEWEFASWEASKASQVSRRSKGMIDERDWWSWCQSKAMQKLCHKSLLTFITFSFARLIASQLQAMRKITCEEIMNKLIINCFFNLYIEQNI